MSSPPTYNTRLTFGSLCSAQWNTNVSISSGRLQIERRKDHACFGLCGDAGHTDDRCFLQDISSTEIRRVHKHGRKGLITALCLLGFLLLIAGAIGILVLYLAYPYSSNNYLGICYIGLGVGGFMFVLAFLVWITRPTYKVLVVGVGNSINDDSFLVYGAQERLYEVRDQVMNAMEYYKMPKKEMTYTSPMVVPTRITQPTGFY